MVNVGGPSKGCLTCIRRKIKCSREQPTCQQCTRSNRRCEGYRNVADLIFRDQSKETVARVHGDLAKPDISGNQMIRAHTSPSLGLPISPTLDEATTSIDFFANNFASSDAIEERNNLFWVPQRLDILLEDRSFRLSMQSAGAMAIARLNGCSNYTIKAQMVYGQSLLSVAGDWKRDCSRRKASTMTALLLSFFEVLASFDGSSRQAWKTHLLGVESLMPSSTAEFTATDFGAKVFRQTRSQAIIYALQSWTPVAEKFSDPYAHLGQGVPEEFDHADMLLIRLANLRARFATSPASSDLEEQLATLRKDFTTWQITLPPRWSFSLQPSERSCGLWWDARHDIYSSGFIAHTWNKIRAAQIMTIDLMTVLPAARQRRLQQAIEHHDDNSSARLQQLATDICATIPPYYRPACAGAVGKPLSAMPPALGTVFWFIWVLEIVGLMAEAPAELTSWIAQCCENMYRTTGVIMAQLCAQRLRNRHNGPTLP